MKIFLRIILLNTILHMVIGFIFNARGTPFSITKPISDLQIGDWLLMFWVIVSLLAFFFWLGYMFYHWGTREFKSKGIKRAWFWGLLLGTFLYLIGPLAYYVIVYEMGKGLKPKVAPD